MRATLAVLATLSFGGILAPFESVVAQDQPPAAGTQTTETPAAQPPSAGTPPNQAPATKSQSTQTSQGQVTPGEGAPTEASKTEGADAAPAPAAASPEGSDRVSAYRTFREHFDARRFTEALPAAQQVVTLTEQRYGPNAVELATPLSNLGTTMLRLKDTNGAALQFQRAVKIVESHNGAFSREVIAPLFGLGVTYAAAGDYLASTESLRRAVDVSRKLDGLFNIDQLSLVETLIASYVGLGQYEDAEREQQYALRLAETAYGRYDPRLIPILERGARWLEDAGRFIAARQTYARALEIARKAGGDQDPRMITPLRGISRMYRLEYVYGVEPVGPVAGTNGPQGSGSVYGPTTSQVSTEAPGMLNEAGEDALKLALAVLEAHPDLATAQRGDTLIELGDWYMVAAKPRDAMRTYKEAWTALAAPGAKGTAALDAPTQIIYRPPSSARRNPTVDPEEYTEAFVEVEFVVTPEGRVKDPAIATSTAPDTVNKSVVTSLRRARYRPRFVDGSPVLTTGVRHRQPVYLRAPKSEA
jgi:tetratricopeptide (TPR) repeat protein